MGLVGRAETDVGTTRWLLDCCLTALLCVSKRIAGSVKSECGWGRQSFGVVYSVAQLATRCMTVCVQVPFRSAHHVCKR